MKYLFYTVFLFLFPCSVFSQAAEEAFMHIGKTPVYTEEFLRMYRKNLELKTADKEMGLDGFLDLFVLYKQKIAEAKRLGLDLKPEYIKEVATYNKSLSRQFFEESLFTHSLLEELYERSLLELHASHILINLSPHVFGKDTLPAYERIKTLKDRAEAGEDFNKLAGEYSQEVSANETLGDLGYFTAMQMLIPFEDAAYNTPIGGVSNIVRTAYGYHIIKVHGQRKAESKLRVAHILILDGGEESAAEAQILEAYSKLQEGEDFVELALKYSQDVGTHETQAELEVFGRREIQHKIFADVAYSLQEGEYSQPFKSDLGWHIVLLKEIVPAASRDVKLEEIKSFVQARGVKTWFDKKRAEALWRYLDYELLENDYATNLLQYIDRDYLLLDKEYTSLLKEEDKALFKLKTRVFTFSDFLSFLETNKQYATQGMPTEQILFNALNDFKTEAAILVYMQEENKQNQEYLNQLESVSNDILLFDLMQQEVWEKALTDLVGQREYHQKHQADFNLPKRWELEVYTTQEEGLAKQILEKLKSGVQKEEIGKEFAVYASFEVWNEEQRKAALNGVVREQQLPMMIHSGREYKVVQLLQVLAAEKRDFTAAQEEVAEVFVKAYEKKWVKALKKKHRLKLNKKKWEKIKSENI